MTDRIDKIHTALSNALATDDIVIRDDGHEHAGHAARRQGLGHFHVTIRSARFDGINPLERHKLVYNAMGSLMQTDVHALQIRALASDE